MFSEMQRFILSGIVAMSVASMAAAQNKETIEIQPGERWWGAVTTQGVNMPYAAMDDYIDLSKNYSNQTVPFLVSNMGRYIWSEDPFCFRFTENSILIESGSEVVCEKAGDDMKSAFRAASAAHFPASGKMPSELFMSVPQYNTWIELVYDQNQEDVLKYARSIIENGFPAGVLMIDDNWQKYYGNFEFKTETFPRPKEMVEQLHAMGFKVMLWICPYVSPDSKEYRFLRNSGYLIKDRTTGAPAIFDWWNGKSACYDLSNPEAYAYLLGVLKNMQKEYGIDGFKFDAGDAGAYDKDKIAVFDGKSYGPGQSELWAKMGTEFDFNEYRACWKMAGQPVVQRLSDKTYSWDALDKLIPDMLAAGIMGHPYTCPDMIGGGEFQSFRNVTPENIDQNLIVRSCQVHAMMPMMQFSVAPWRILDEEHLSIVRHYANLHKEYGGYILSLAENASETGEPIVRYMEYEFPGQGFEECKDQFMLGDRYLVAPILSKDNVRTVSLPEGRWKDDQGKKFRGPKKITVEAGIERLPVYERID